MGCASTTPMLVHDPAAQQQGNGNATILRNVESGAANLLDKVGQEVSEAAAKAAGHAKEEVQRALSAATLPVGSQDDNRLSDLVTDMEGEMEKKMIEEVPLPSLTPSSLPDALPTTEDISNTLAELQDVLPIALDEVITKEEPEILEEPPLMTTETVAEPTLTMPTLTEPTSEENMEEALKIPENITLQPIMTPFGIESTKEEDEMLLTVPVMSSAGEDSDSSDVDFHMTLEDMEILEAQLRALSSPPPHAGVPEDELSLSVPVTPCGLGEDGLRLSNPESVKPEPETTTMNPDLETNTEIEMDTETDTITMNLETTTMDTEPATTIMNSESETMTMDTEPEKDDTDTMTSSAETVIAADDMK